MNYRKWIFIIIIVAVLIGIGLSAGYAWGFKAEQAVFDKKFSSIHPLRNNSTDYKFIDPLLLYIIPSADQQWGLIEMKNKITKVITDDKKNNGLTTASVFFQDLNMGRWMGIDQNVQYDPASMLKVVVMVSYYKKAEDNPAILNQSVIYTSELENLIAKDPYNQLSNLVVGKEYTIEDLIKKMIVESDNGATYLLLNNISQASLNSVYSALDIPSPEDIKGDFTISPRYYSFFFRILYSATYLSDQYSEKALNILSVANFKEGIFSGVANDTVVAHKYGQHVILQNDQVSQIELHDCGIVYYPKSPYLLCIMTKGNSLENLKNTLQKISSIVYQNYSSIK